MVQIALTRQEREKIGFRLQDREEFIRLLEADDDLFHSLDMRFDDNDLIEAVTSIGEIG